MKKFLIIIFFILFWTNHSSAQVAIIANKSVFGINWACTMDVAIRAANWTVSFDLVRKSLSIANDFLFTFLGSLYEHGRHIRLNLERGRVTVNHYLADIAGLTFVAQLFRSS